MSKIFSALAAAGMVASLTAAPAEARWFGGGFHHGFHHFHYGHWGHRWSYHYHYRWAYHYHCSHWGYHYHWGYRHYGYRPLGYRVAIGGRACPPGTHLGYLGRFCHPND